MNMSEYQQKQADAEARVNAAEDAVHPLWQKYSEYKLAAQDGHYYELADFIRQHRDELPALVAEYRRLISAFEIESRAAFTGPFSIPLRGINHYESTLHFMEQVAANPDAFEAREYE